MMEIEVRGDVRVNMALDTLSTLSSLGEQMWDSLAILGFLDEGSQRGVRVVQHATLERQPLPSFPVRRSRRVIVPGVNGFLGLSFFQSFSEVSIDVGALQLILTSR